MRHLTLGALPLWPVLCFAGLIGSLWTSPLAAQSDEELIRAARDLRDVFSVSAGMDLPGEQRRWIPTDTPSNLNFLRGLNVDWALVNITELLAQRHEIRQQGGEAFEEYPDIAEAQRQGGDRRLLRLFHAVLQRFNRGDTRPLAALYRLSAAVPLSPVRQAIVENYLEVVATAFSRKGVVGLLDEAARAEEICRIITYPRRGFLLYLDERPLSGSSLRRNSNPARLNSLFGSLEQKILGEEAIASPHFHSAETLFAFYRVPLALISHFTYYGKTPPEVVRHHLVRTYGLKIEYLEAGPNSLGSSTRLVIGIADPDIAAVSVVRPLRPGDQLFIPSGERVFSIPLTAWKHPAGTPIHQAGADMDITDELFIDLVREGDAVRVRQVGPGPFRWRPPPAELLHPLIGAGDAEIFEAVERFMHSRTYTGGWAPEELLGAVRFWAHHTQTVSKTQFKKHRRRDAGWDANISVLLNAQNDGLDAIDRAAIREAEQTRWIYYSLLVDALPEKQRALVLEMGAERGEALVKTVLDGQTDIILRNPLQAADMVRKTLERDGLTEWLARAKRERAERTRVRRGR